MKYVYANVTKKSFFCHKTSIFKTFKHNIDELVDKSLTERFDNIMFRVFLYAIPNAMGHSFGNSLIPTLHFTHPMPDMYRRFNALNMYPREYNYNNNKNDIANNLSNLSTIRETFTTFVTDEYLGEFLMSTNGIDGPFVPVAKEIVTNRFPTLDSNITPNPSNYRYNDALVRYKESNQFFYGDPLLKKTYLKRLITEYQQWLADIYLRMLYGPTITKDSGTVTITRNRMFDTKYTNRTTIHRDGLYIGYKPITRQWITLGVVEAQEKKMIERTKRLAGTMLSILSDFTPDSSSTIPYNFRQLSTWLPMLAHIIPNDHLEDLDEDSIMSYDIDDRHSCIIYEDFDSPDIYNHGII